MYIKLNNDTWEKYINEYFSLENKISIKQFCKERNINPSQFFYHRKRIEARDKPIVLQAINFKTSATKKEKTFSESKINIQIGNTNISIPVSETTLINSIIKELLQNA